MSEQEENRFNLNFHIQILKWGSTKIKDSIYLLSYSTIKYKILNKQGIKLMKTYL